MYNVNKVIIKYTKEMIWNQREENYQWPGNNATDRKGLLIILGNNSVYSSIIKNLILSSVKLCVNVQ